MNLSNENAKVLIAENSDLSVECRSNLLKAALSTFQPSCDRSKICQKFSQSYNIDERKLVELLGLYIEIIRLFTKVNDDEFNNKLLDFGFTAAFVEELPLIRNRNKIIETLRQREVPERLTSLKWGIAISSVTTVPASVILCLNFGNGDKHTININRNLFNKLRFAVAILMKEFSNLKSHN